MSKFTEFAIGSPFTVINTTTAGSAVSTTGIQLLNSVLIPANTFNANDIVFIMGGVSKSGALGSLTVYFYWNTSASLSGAIQLGVSATQGAVTRYYISQRMLDIINTSNNTLLPPVSVAGNSPFTIYAGAASNAAINWTNAGYIILAADHSSASESVTGEWIRVANY
jgi:hypothetical protein